MMECHMCDLSYHALVPSSMNTLESGLCVLLLLLHRGLLLAHTAYQHWALGVFRQSPGVSGGSLTPIPALTKAFASK